MTADRADQGRQVLHHNRLSAADKRMDDPAIVRKMNQSVEYSDRRDIDSTPTIVIENAIKPNRTFDNLVTIINALLKDPVP